MEEIYPSGMDYGEDEVLDDLEVIKSLDSDLANFADKLDIPLDSVDVKSMLEKNAEVDKHGTMAYPISNSVLCHENI